MNAAKNDLKNGDSVEKTGTYSSYQDFPPVQWYAEKQFVPSERFSEKSWAAPVSATSGLPTATRILPLTATPPEDG